MGTDKVEFRWSESAYIKLLYPDYPPMSTPMFFEVTASPKLQSAVNVQLIQAQVIQAQPIQAQLIQTQVGVPLEQSMLLNQVDQIRWINPKLAAAIAEIRPMPQGKPRAHITVPISPVMDLSDRILYEDPRNPNQKLYLPRYRVEEANGQPQIFLRPSGLGGRLSVRLQRYPDAYIQTQNGSELGHSVTVILRHTLKPGSTEAGYKDWEFQEISIYDGGIQAVLQVNSLLERDLLYQVLTNPIYGASLIVRRAINVAIPTQEMTIQMVNPIVSSGQGTVRGTWNFNLDKGLEGDAVSDIWWNQKTTTDRAMVPQGNAQIYYLGAANFDAIGVKDLEALQYTRQEIASTEATERIPIDIEPIAMERIRPDKRIFKNLKIQALRPMIRDDDGGVGEPIIPILPKRFTTITRINGLKQGDVFAVLTNGGNYAKVQVVTYGYNIVLRWITYSPSIKEPLYREVNRAIDDLSERSPFVFPEKVYPYIFSGINASNQTFQPIRRQVMWQSPTDLQPRMGTYFQDPVTPYLFYYLPDAFKIVRRPQSLHYPILSLDIHSIDGSEATTQVTLNYAAIPVINRDRLAAAAQELQRYMTGPLPTSVTGPMFQALATDTARLYMQMPTATGGTMDQVRSAVRVNLDSGFKDSITLPLAQFSSVFNAVFSDSILMQGYVLVDFSDIPDEQIPFIAQMDDMAGDLLDYKVQPDPSGGLRVTLTNAIESPLRINDLSAKLHRGGPKVLANFSGLTTPMELASTQAVTFVVTPSEPIVGSEILQALFDLSGVEVLSSKRAILDVVLKNDQQPEYERSIEVEVFRELFDANAPDPLRVVTVEFKPGNQSVQLRPDHLKATGVIRFPLKEVWIGEAQSGEYQYRVASIRQNSTHTSEWMTETTVLLFPDVT